MHAILQFRGLKHELGLPVLLWNHVIASNDHRAQGIAAKTDQRVIRGIQNSRGNAYTRCDKQSCAPHEFILTGAGEIR